MNSKQIIRFVFNIAQERSDDEAVFRLPTDYFHTPFIYYMLPRIKKNCKMPLHIYEGYENCEFSPNCLIDASFFIYAEYSASMIFAGKALKTWM